MEEMSKGTGFGPIHKNKTQAMGATVNPLPFDVQKVTPEITQSAVVNRTHEADGRLAGTKKGS